MSFCLPQDIGKRFVEALRKGELDPEKLSEMSSEERQTAFAKVVGAENAKDTNILFEQKLLLKNYKNGLQNWVEKAIGLKPQAKRDLLSRIEKMDNVLNPSEEKTFLKDLAEKRLGVGVDFEEAKQITDLTNKVKETRTEHEKTIADLTKEFKESYAKESGEAPSQADIDSYVSQQMKHDTDRLGYGRAQVGLKNYVENLKAQAQRLTLRDVARNPLRIGEAIASNAKAIQASMDNSAIFRQGWKTMWTHPGIWARNSARSFQHLFKYFGQEKVMDELNADIMSRPTYDLMKQAKLDVGVAEEAFPTTLPEKIPVLGRVYKATENAYTAFVRKTRADVFDRYIDIARKSGVELNEAELQSIGKMVNSLTGRGHLGRLEPVTSTANVLFFSPKLLKAHLDTLTQPLTGAGGSNFVRKQAAINLLKMAAGTAVVLAVAKALKPDAVELDPRSSDFGKIKVGNARFEVMGGMSSLLVLLSRVATQTSKSSMTGKFSDLTNPAYGKDNLVDVTEKFFENKLAPAMGMIRDFAKGETFEGRKPTIAGELLSLFTPLPLKTMAEILRDPEARKDPRFAALAEVADMLGIATNVYGQRLKVKKPDLDIGKFLEGLRSADLDKILDTDEPVVEKPKKAPKPGKPSKPKKFFDDEGVYASPLTENDVLEPFNAENVSDFPELPRSNVSYAPIEPTKYNEKWRNARQSKNVVESPNSRVIARFWVAAQDYDEELMTKLAYQLKGKLTPYEKKQVDDMVKEYNRVKQYELSK